MTDYNSTQIGVILEWKIKSRSGLCPEEHLTKYKEFVELIDRSFIKQSGSIYVAKQYNQDPFGTLEYTLSVIKNTPMFKTGLLDFTTVDVIEIKKIGSVKKYLSV